MAEKSKNTQNKEEVVAPEAKVKAPASKKAASGVKTATAKTTASKPATAKSAAAKPTASKPATAKKPAAAKTATAKTTAAKSATAKSAAAKPSATKTATQKTAAPKTTKAATAKSATAKKPAAAKPSVKKPAAETAKPQETKAEEIKAAEVKEEEVQVEAVKPEEITAEAVKPAETEEVKTENSVVSAKDSTLDQTVSAVSSQSAIFDRQGLDVDVVKERKKQKVFGITKNIFVYLFLTICAVLAFLPFYWMIISSVKTEMEYRESTPTFFPHTFKWKNYPAVLNQTSGSGGSFWQILINTLTVGLFSTTIGVIVTIITAYALARMNFKGKNILFSLMMATMMIPGEMFTLTNYLTVSSWRWNDTFTVLILPFLVSVYYIYLLRNNFMQIPNSLYQAAKVDGLSDMGYLIKVMVPLTAPTLISITLLKFIGTWNSYIWPRLVNSQSWQMITNWVTRGFVDRGGVLYNGLYSASESLNTLKMAAVCMVSLPLFLLFIFCRKYIMHGVSKSGTKG